MNNEEALLVLAAILPDVSPCPEAIEKERARLDAEQAKAGWKIEPSKEAFAKQSKVFAERLVEYERELIASTAASELAAFHDATVQIARKIQGLGFQDKRLDKKGEVNKQIKQLFDKLNKLGHVARMHLHDVAGEDIVAQMLVATQATFLRMDTDVFINNMVVRLAKEELERRKIACTNKKNGDWVAYVRVIAAMLNIDSYDAYFQVRRFLEKV